jgi:hypothetical protein
VKHIIPMKNNANSITAAKIIVYTGEFDNH